MPSIPTFSTASANYSRRIDPARSIKIRGDTLNLFVLKLARYQIGRTYEKDIRSDDLHLPLCAVLNSAAAAVHGLIHGSTSLPRDVKPTLSNSPGLKRLGGFFEVERLTLAAFEMYHTEPPSLSEQAG